MATKKATKKVSGPVGRYVVVRTYSAGVHIGTVVAFDGKSVTLKDARRVWYWAGAFTLSAVATAGVGAGSKLSCVVPEIILTEAIEVIPCTPAAAAALHAFPVHTP